MSIPDTKTRGRYRKLRELNSRGKRKLCLCLGVACASVRPIATEGDPGGRRPVFAEDWTLQELSAALAGVVPWVERQSANQKVLWTPQRSYQGCSAGASCGF